MVDKCVKEIIEATGNILDSKQAKEILAEITRQVDSSGKTIEQINLELADSVALQIKNVQVNKINTLKQRIKVQENTKFFVDRINEANTADQAKKIFRDDLNLFTDRIETTVNTEKFNLNSKFATLLRDNNIDIKNLKEADSNKVAEFVAEIAQDQKGVFRDLRSLPPELQDEYKIAKAVFAMNEHIREYKNALGVPTEFLQGRIAKQAWSASKIAGRELEFKNKFKLALDLDRMGITLSSNVQNGIDPVLFDQGVEELADKLVKEVISGRFTDEIELDSLNIDDLFKPIASSKAGDAALKYPKAKNRKIHLKPTSWNALMDEFGGGDVLESLRKDISLTAKTAAMTKELGPDYQTAWEKTFNLVADNTKKYGQGGGHFATDNIVQKRYDALTGLKDRPLNADGALVAKANDTWRRVVGGANLGQVVLSSIPDLATPGFRQAILGINPTQNSFVSQLGSLADNLKMAFNVYGDVEGKRISQIMLEELETQFWDLAEEFRFSESFTDDLYQTGSKRVLKVDAGTRVAMGADDLRGLPLAEGLESLNKSEFWAKARTGASKGLDALTQPFDFLAKYNFSKAWTDRRVANTYTSIARDLGSLAETSYANLSKVNKQWIDEIGIGKVWDTLRTKVTTAENGRAYIAPDAMKNLTDAELDSLATTYLVPKDIAAEQADLALKSAFGIESRKRVLRPGASTKSILQILEGNRGTLWGEVNRYYSQFKSYPTELIFNNILPAINKGKYGAVGGFIAIGVMMNMATRVIKDVAANKTPRTFAVWSNDDEERATALTNFSDVLVSAISVPFMGELVRSVAMAAQGNSRAKESLYGDIGKFLLGPSGQASVSTGVDAGLATAAFVTGSEQPNTVRKDTAEFLKRISGANSTILAPILNGYLLPTLYELIDPDYIERMEDIAERQGSEIIVDQ